MISSFSSSPSRKLLIINGYILLVAFLFGLLSTLSAVPPQLVGEARWMTKGENPSYLDIYPLFGRAASSEIFVQVDLSGAGPIEANQVEFFLENTQLLPVDYSVDADVEIIKGNPSGATVQAELEVFNYFLWDQYTEGATLALKMRTSDSGGAEMVYTIGEVGLYGPKDVPPDTILPGAVTEAEVNGGNPVSIPLGFTEDEFTFPGTIRASDVGKGIQALTLLYRSPIGDFLVLEADMFDLSEGTVNEGLFDARGEIFPFAEAGIYDLNFAVAEDKYGNVIALPLAELSASVQKTVAVINPNADIEPPMLTSPVTLDPEAVNVTEEEGDIVFTFSASDEGSGLSIGIITAFHKTDPDARAWQVAFSPEEDFLTSGDAQMGTYAVTLTMIPGVTPGEYSYQIQLYDNAFRQRRYGLVRPGSQLTPEPLPAGSEEDFTVENTTPIDATAPILDSIVCRTYETGNPEGPGNHNFATGSGVLEITMMITENESQLASGFFFGGGNRSYVRVISPTGATDVTRTIGGIFFIPDVSNPGRYVVNVPLSRSIEPGAYCIEVKLENSSGSNEYYGFNYDYMAFPGNFPGTCELINEGPVDFTPPVPVDFSVSPNFVPAGTDTTLNVTMRVTDGLTVAGGTGLQSGTIFLQNGIFSSDEFRTPLWNSPFTPPEDGGIGTGNRYDGTYTFEIPVTAADIVGDFLSFQINLIDRAGNSRSYDTSICNTNGARYPLPFHEAQVGAEPEKRPPTINSQPFSQTVVLGESAALSIRASGAANITYQWYKDNVAINDSATISGATSDRLSLSNITESDLGMYYVVASSEGETVTSNTATLSVANDPNADFATYLEWFDVPVNLRDFADDADRDGFDNGIEFLMGSDANDPSSIPQIVPSTIMVGGQEYFAVSFPQNTLATDVYLKTEFSSSIDFDASTEGVEVSREVVSGVVERVTQRSNDTVGSKKRIFGRFRGGD